MAAVASLTAVGVKGSDVYTVEGLGSNLLALSVKAVRGAEQNDLLNLVEQLLADPQDSVKRDLIVLAFQTRDIRGGKGERAVFHTIVERILTKLPSLTGYLLPLVPEYGSWKDIFTLAKNLPSLRDEVFKVAAAQLKTDEVAVERGETSKLSLVGKWAPREGNKDDALAREFAAYLSMDPVRCPKSRAAAMASYRRRVAALNRALKTVETFECSGRWDEIEPKRVPARARQLKLHAYLNEKKPTLRGGEPVLRHPDDAKRMACREHFQEYLRAAAAGKVTISGAKTLYPHEVVERALRAHSEDEKNSLNAVWTQMVSAAAAGGGLGSSIAMCDFSGSMHGTPYWVSMAMGLLIAAVNSGPFRGKFLGFSTDPEWLTVDPMTPLTHQLPRLNTGGCQGLSTDFQKAMDKVLGTLKAARTPPGEEPKNLIVITDMGFDAACGSNEVSAYTNNTYRHHVKTAPWQTHIQAIRESFRRAGEDMWGDSAAWQPPRIVIWNVAASYTNDFHAQADTDGVIMLSGWSPSLFKVLCEEGPRVMNPMDALRAQLDDVRYDAVREAFERWRSSGWRGVA